MQFKTTFQSCLYHTASLERSVERMRVQLELFRSTDHHETAMDSPFLLEIDEELIELNVRMERLIQRLDPSFSGEYTGEDH